MQHWPCCSFLSPSATTHLWEACPCRKAPNIYFKKKKTGGISFNATLPLTHMDEKMVQRILQVSAALELPGMSPASALLLWLPNLSLGLLVPGLVSQAARAASHPGGHQQLQAFRAAGAAAKVG